MKLLLATALHKRKKKNRTHTAPRDDGALPRQVRKLRRYYDRLSRVAARLEGRPAQRAGVTFKLVLAATMVQHGLSRRAATNMLLRERAAKLEDERAE